MKQKVRIGVASDWLEASIGPASLIGPSFWSGFSYWTEHLIRLLWLDEASGPFVMSSLIVQYSNHSVDIVQCGYQVHYQVLSNFFEFVFFIWICCTNVFIALWTKNSSLCGLKMFLFNVCFNVQQIEVLKSTSSSHFYPTKSINRR